MPNWQIGFKMNINYFNLFFQLPLVGCTDQGNPISVSGPVEIALNECSIQPIFHIHCAGCHTAGGSEGGLGLSSTAGDGNWVDIISTGFAPELIVVPGDTTHSILWQRLRGINEYMPPADSLDNTELDIISDWIMTGAPLPIIEEMPLEVSLQS